MTQTVAKGIFRLLLVLFAVSWIGAAIMTYQEIDKDRWQLDGHFSPYSRGDHSQFLPTELYWPVYAATPEFISLPLRERELKAKIFYQKYVSFWEPTWDLDPLQEWIVESSQHSIQKAPIRTVNWDGREVSYREFRQPGIWNHPRLSHFAFDSNTLLIAVFFWIVLVSILAIAFSIVKWIVRGFQKS